MRSRTIAIAIFVLVLGLVLLLHGQSSQKPMPPPTTFQRFQMFGAQTEEQADKPDQVISEHSVFLVDTETGRVWRYQGVRKTEIGGKLTFFDAKFLLIEMEKQKN